MNALAFGMAGYLFYFFSQVNLPDKVIAHWINLDLPQNGVLQLNYSVFRDSTSSLMLLLVSGITLLVQVFSTEYMRHDPMRHRYWGFLGLFAFSMTGLVLVSDLALVFVFWELVGVSSYFLIGFWFKEAIPAKASQKAMVVNRLGDIALFSGLMILLLHFGTLNIPFVNDGAAVLMQNAQELGMGYFSLFPPLLTLGGILILIGICSKSAQLPLQIWLPDAMAGPTPVSALIHAATMVIAGVYLLMRILPSMGPVALMLAVFIGGITALMAAYSAIAQTDIKKVLAYSTISQLGFMVMGMGTGHYEWSFLHLLTHAFFKAGLFLVAGAVIHTLHTFQHDLEKDGIHTHFDPQDIRWMGGLRKVMPKTFVLYLVFVAALVGLPFFSGFLSKDGILASTLQFAHRPEIKGVLGGLSWMPAILGIAATFFTALYISRHALLIFGGNSRLHLQLDHADKYIGRIKEVNWRMLLPMVILAIGSLAWVFAPLQTGFEHHTYIPVLEQLPPADKGTLLLQGQTGEDTHSTAILFSLLATFAGLGIGYLFYRKAQPGMDDTRDFRGKLSFHHFFIDLFYENFVAKLFLKATRAFAWIDHKVVDGMVNLLARIFVGSSSKQVSISSAANWMDHKVVDATIDGAAKEFADDEDRVSTLSGIVGWFDAKIVDGLVNRVGWGIGLLANAVRKLQPGKVQIYISFTVLALLALVAYLIYFGRN